LKAQLDENTPLNTIIAEKRRSVIKLKPRNKEVLDPRGDKFSPDLVRRQPVKKTRARKPAIVESDSEDLFEDPPYEEQFIYQQREKIPPKRGGKVSKRAKK